MGALDNVFKIFFYSICDVAKWIIAIKMATNVIKGFESSNLRDIIQDVLTGAFAYGVLYSIIDILDAVKSQF